MNIIHNSILFLDAAVSPASTVTSGVSDIANSSSTIADSITKNGIYPTLIAILICVVIVLTIFLAYTMLTNKKKLQEEVDKGRTSDRDMLNDLVGQLLQSYLSQHPSIVSNTQAQQPQSQQSQSNNNNQNNTNATSQNNQPASNVQQQTTSDYHSDIVGAYIKVSLELKDICRTVDLKLGCSRVAIYVFHNGNSSLYGLPFFKMSCISEYYSQTDIHQTRGKNHVDLPLHLFDDIVESLYNHDVYVSENVEDKAKFDSCIEEFVRYSNAKALAAKGIKNDEGSLAGFIVAEFPNIDTFESDKERYNTVTSVLTEASGSAKVLIANKYVYEKTSKKK